MGENDEGFAGPIIKDIWRITRGFGNGGGKQGGLECWVEVGER